MAGAHLHLVHLEERLAEGLERSLQVAEMRRLVDHQPFDLMEHRCGSGRIGAEGAPGAMMRIGGCMVSIERICTGEVWVRAPCGHWSRGADEGRRCRAPAGQDAPAGC